MSDLTPAEAIAILRELDHDFRLSDMSYGSHIRHNNAMYTVKRKLGDIAFGWVEQDLQNADRVQND